MHDTDCRHYQVARADPSLPLETHMPNFLNTQGPEVSITTLQNGITVVTESPSFPGTVDFNIMVDVGTRDEAKEESGSLLALKNTYLKTILSTNETINYGMVQMSGGSSMMTYDQETSLYRASCLSHDAVDIFSMISDCALEPKSVVASSVGMMKNQHTHGLEAVHDSGAEFTSLLARTAYGLNGLGNPLNGIKGNISMLTASTLQRFQLRNITPRRLWIGAAGIENHQEFVDLVDRKLSFIPS